MKKAVSLVLVMSMAVAALAGCGASNKNKDTFYIGGIGPTTGTAAIYGNAVSNGAQFFITGDLKYHYALELKEKGLNVLDAGHFDTEKVFPQAMSRFIRRRITELGDIDIIESGADVNPFEYR